MEGATNFRALNAWEGGGGVPMSHVDLKKCQCPLLFIRLYPMWPLKEDGSLAINIDASKGFVDLWVHVSFTIFAIFDLKRQLKLLEMAFDQVQTYFPFDGHIFL